jgi:hypothetical protein
MSPIPQPKVVQPGEARTVKLFAVRFDYKVTSAEIEELERTYGVKL